MRQAHVHITRPLFNLPTTDSVFPQPSSNLVTQPAAHNLQYRSRPATAEGVAVQELARQDVNHHEHPVQIVDVDGDEDTVARGGPRTMHERRVWQSTYRQQLTHR